MSNTSNSKTGANSKTVDKPCPGLDGIYCGQPRGSKGTATYCDVHRRLYQRRRHESLRREAGKDYTTREVTRTVQELCDCCGAPAPGDLGKMDGCGDNLVCGQCYQFAQNVIDEFGYGRFRRIVEFAYDKPMAYLPGTRRVTENKANPTKPKPGTSNADMLFGRAKAVTVDEAFEYEYVRRVWDAAKRYGFDMDGDDTFEYCDTNFGPEIRQKLQDAVADRTFELKTELTEEEAPWLF